MANKRFYNLQDFKDYIHEDESYDVHGNLNADLLRPVSYTHLRAHET